MNSASSPKPHDTVRSQLRLPAELHQRVAQAAEESGRSMNAEIVHRIEQTFSADPQAAEMAHDFRYVLLDLVEHGKVTPETLSRIKKNAGAAPSKAAKSKKGK
ncbi:TPA: Arc family DNA-binding protein [Stenotrophomonas maltophilia]|nr:Arc family DNA-binding protein [Stenotrophomonas maltophilia]